MKTGKKCTACGEINDLWASKCKSCDENLENIKVNQHKEKIKEIENVPEYDPNIRDIQCFTVESLPLLNVLKVYTLVRGSTVRAKHIGRDMMAELKSVVGGELKGYTELLAEGREEALYRMKVDANNLGANAVIGIRFASSSPTANAVEIIAYGTAVEIQKDSGNE